MDGTILEKGNCRVTWHLGEEAVQTATQDGRGKKEERVRGHSRERGQAYIDAADVVRRPGTAAKAVRRAIPYRKQ